MRSATAVDGGGRDRILAAALARFAADGMGATIRAIAADADVSPALVVHHFDTKDGLRAACDEHVRTTIREGKLKALDGGGDVDALEALRTADESLPVMRYLARVLTSGGDSAAKLFDEIVADAEMYVQKAIDNGFMRPTEDLHAMVTVLTTWQLGALALHEHVARHLGADLTGDVAGLTAWMVPAGKILGEGVMDDRGRALLEDIAGTFGSDDAADPSPRIDRTEINDPSGPTSPDPPDTAAR